MPSQQMVSNLTAETSRLTTTLYHDNYLISGAPGRVNGALFLSMKKLRKNRSIVSYEQFINNRLPSNFCCYSSKSGIFDNTTKAGGMLDHTLYFPKSSGARFSRYSAHFLPSSLLSSTSTFSSLCWDLVMTLSST